MNDANATNVSDEDLERSVNKVHLSLNLKDSDLDKDQLKMQYKKRAEFWSNFMDKWSSVVPEAEEEEEGIDPEDFPDEEEDLIPAEEDDDNSHADDELTSSENEDDNCGTKNDESWVRRVRSIQQNVTIIEEVNDMPCDICGQRTYLPFEYMENVGESLCKECMTKESGHEDCTIDECSKCLEIAAEVVNRETIAYLFCTNQLAIAKNDTPAVESPSKKSLNRSLATSDKVETSERMFQDLRLNECSPPKRTKKFHSTGQTSTLPKEKSCIIPDGGIRIPSPSPRSLNTSSIKQRFKIRSMK